MALGQKQWMASSVGFSLYRTRIENRPTEPMRKKRTACFAAAAYETKVETLRRTLY